MQTNSLVRPAARLAAPFLAFLLTVAPARGQETNAYAGLWVGEALLNAVSDANPVVPDLRFDLRLDGVLTEETLVAGDAEWRYLDNATADPGTAWREKGFNDTAWKTGSGPFGYGDGGEATTLLSNNLPTAYFRTAVVVADPARYSGLRCRLLKDDAAVVYLNGGQVRRSNLAAIYNGSTLALSRIEGADETAYEVFTIPVNLLQATNMIAVELHQYSRWDPDSRFAFELVGVVSEPAPVTLKPALSTWKYDDGGTDPGAAWREPGFDDAGWKSGAAPFGYGNGTNYDVTRLEAGDPTNRNPTAYFRASFLLPDPASFSQLQLHLVRDDGAVVYINGVEALRSNMPADGAIERDTDPLASVSAADELTYLKYSIPSTALVAGTNVIAVSIHQRTAERIENASAETPAPAGLSLRLLLHVDAGGTARLLKEVTQLWKPGTYRPVEGGQVVDQPGRYVLITDESRLADFSPAGMIDGEGVGRRLSAAGFDFDAPHLDFTGAPGPGGTLEAVWTLPAGFRTNPFRHAYHPDHKTGLEVTRALRLSFSSRYPADDRLPEGSAPPGWGVTRLGGRYRETLTGLHRNPLSVSGSFELERIATTDRLND